ncbi:MAG: sensor histidine kinase, partial [Gammaproteobacteria bacterium]|nr:sensor histidine kinase [Gammaproteobacteria bacterium]
NWFCSQIIISPQYKIMILDDDESIHQIWEKRFNQLNCNFQFINYYNPQDLLNFDKNILSSIDLFLIDYEYIDYTTNGLNLIEKLGITNRSYLVTSRHEENEIRKHCEKIGLKIIPKAFAIYIPITVSKKNIKSVDLIFIDDDLAITNAWRLHGFTKGKSVATYNSIQAFQADVDQYDSDIPVYIDSEFNDKITGQDFAKELFDIGFKVIYLATGHSANNFQDMYWIKNIVGKEPPF